MQNPEKRNGCTYAIIGSSGCGKSHLLKTIFLDNVYLDDIDRLKYGLPKYNVGSKKQKYIVILFTTSAKSDVFEERRAIKNKRFLIDKRGVDEDIINYCYNINLKSEKKYRFIIILDDCIHIRYQKMIERMFLTMRNMNISSIISLQYARLIQPAIRTSVYFTFLFCQNSDEGIELAVRSWLSSYLEGASLKAKMESFRVWTNKENGHCFYMLDNLNHTCFKVNSSYQCEQLPMISCVTGLEFDWGMESSGNTKEEFENQKRVNKKSKSK